MKSSSPPTEPRRSSRRAWGRNPARPKRSPNASVATSRSGGASRSRLASAPSKELAAQSLERPRPKSLDIGKQSRPQNMSLKICLTSGMDALLKTKGMIEGRVRKRERRRVADRSTAANALEPGAQRGKMPDQQTRSAAAGL